MRMKHPIVQVLVIVAFSTAVAVVANGFASRTRRLVLPGWYPNALTVPKKAAEEVPPPPIAAPTTTVAQSSGPGQPPMVVPTTTVERPAGTTTTAEAPPKPVATTTTAAPAPATPTPALTPAAAPAADALARFTPHPDKAYVEIGGDDVAVLHSRGALFLDARRTSVYEQGHIAGARSFSVWEADIDDKVRTLYSERSDPTQQNLPIVIYCSGGACEDSHMLAQKLWEIQFNNVYVYKDGYPDWLKRGGATRTGSTP
jgi:rhodanese-related sulfurtransferase